MLAKSLLALCVTVAIAACGKTEAPTVSDTANAPVLPVVQTTASSTAAPVYDDEKLLNIYNWPDYIPEGLVAEFEAETGIKVNYDTFETNEALHSKLVAGSTGYDLVVPSTTFAKSQIGSGFFKPIDKEKIPNLALLDKGIMETLVKVDPGNAYLVPWAWSFNTLGINRTKVEKALAGMPMPENVWDLVFKPEYSSKLKSCGIAYLDAPTEIIPVMLHYLGKNPYSLDPVDFQTAVAAMLPVRKDIRLFSPSLIDDMASGKVCAAIGWAGDFNQAAARARENGSPDVIETLLPSIGALIFFDTMAITKDAKHPNNASTFINFFLRRENAVRMANELGYPTGVLSITDKVDPKLASNKSIFVDPAYMSKMVPPEHYTNEARRAMGDAFNVFKKNR